MLRLFYRLLTFLLLNRISSTNGTEPGESQELSKISSCAFIDQLTIKERGPYKPLHTDSTLFGGECKFEDFDMDLKDITWKVRGGSFYTVQHWKSGKLYSVKKFDSFTVKSDPEILKNEEKIRKASMNHENIVKFYCTMVSDKTDVYFLFEHLKGDTLENLSAKLPFHYE